MISNSDRRGMGLAESVAEQAADWFARLSGGQANEADWGRFWKWRDADTAHASAYDRLSERWQGLQSFADDPALVEMRLKALAERPARQNHWLMAMAATLLAVLLTSAVFLLPQWGDEQARPQLASQTATPVAPPPAPIVKSAPEQAPDVVVPANFRSQFQTATGERSKFSLPDGSVIELNTDSQVDVNYAGGVRNLKLARGEAVFRVAHDKTRPFVVSVADNRVIALGTVFSVRQDSDEAIVTLLEGKVRIERMRGGVATEATQLSPGEQLQTAAMQPFKIRKVDSSSVASWRGGRLVFKNESLGDAVEEINRYSRRKLVIGSSDLSDLRISGTFRIESSDQFAKALESAFPIRAERRGDTGDIVLTRKEEVRAVALPFSTPGLEHLKKN